MMSPAPTQDSMGYSVGYDHQQAYDGSMGYDPSLHQDLSPWDIKIDENNFKYLPNSNPQEKLRSGPRTKTDSPFAYK